MNKMNFFLKWYRQHKWRCFMLFMVFVFAGSVMTGTLLVSENNSYFYMAQSQESVHNTIDSSMLVYKQAEHILSIFSIVSILIIVWGGFTLLLFQDLSMEKTFAMCKVYGMKKRDLIDKALIDFFVYGIISGVFGGISGYWLFLYLSSFVCKISAKIRFFSVAMAGVVLQEILILSTVAFFGSLICGSYVYNKHIMNVVYQRNEYTRYHFFDFVHFTGILILLVEVLLIFSKSIQYVISVLVVTAIIVFLLYIIFSFIFKEYISKKRSQKSLQNMWGLSNRFLCSHNKKDAILAATISIGAVLICFIMNIKFNFSGIITDSYRDNMGYSVGVRMLDWDETGKIENILDENGYRYTLLYSKLMPYGSLHGLEDAKGEFWVAIVGKQTDGNQHFFVPKGTFAVENYFSSYLNINKGDTSGIFGKKMLCNRIISEVQALSLVNFSVLVNEKDWGFELDESFSPIFLLDVENKQINMLKKTLNNMLCEVQTASMIADSLQEIFSKYISVVIIVGSMLVLVTATFFYSMIQNDLSARRTEIFLYQIYGASRKKSKWIIYQEYIIIALISSFSVVFVIMVLGEFFFFFFLHRHYPMSVLVVLVTTLVVACFVMLCCIIAEKVDERNRQIELIRDE